MITQGYERRSLIQDRMYKRTIRAIRAIRDETPLVDPTIGQQFEVPAGSNYYWRVQGGAAGHRHVRADAPQFAQSLG